MLAFIVDAALKVSVIFVTDEVIHVSRPVPVKLDAAQNVLTIVVAFVTSHLLRSAFIALAS
jgi:hypothetical protein